MTVCTSCGAPILWAVTETGKRIPVDREPVAGGNLRLATVERDADGKVTVCDISPPTARVVGATIDLFDPGDNGERWMPHHATCPQANEWRKPR